MPTRLPSIKFKFCLSTRCLHTSSLNFNQSPEVQIENMYKREIKERILMISETKHSNIKMWQPKWSNIYSDKNKLRIHWYIIFVYVLFWCIILFAFLLNPFFTQYVCIFVYDKIFVFLMFAFDFVASKWKFGCCKGEEFDWRQSDKLNNSSPSVTLVSNQTTEQRKTNNKQSKKKSIT